MESTSPSPAAPDAPPLVLLAEDDRDTREMYAMALGFAGYRALEAHNGNQALEQAIEQCPDIVVTDVRLPGLDGFELCRRLKTDERTADIPVIAVTGFSSPDYERRGASAGLSTMLLKPCTPGQLIAEIQRVLQASRELRARSQQVQRRATSLRKRSMELHARSVQISETLQSTPPTVPPASASAGELPERPQLPYPILRESTLSSRLLREYVELPALLLTLRQVQRLFAADERACRQVLEELTIQGILVCGSGGRYGLRTDGPTRARDLLAALDDLEHSPS